MGKLTRFKLEDFDCDTYVETGIGKCDSFAYACSKFDPERCYGVDLDAEFAESARQRFQQSTIFQGKSTQALETWFENSRFQQSDRILFFLDAHYPGSDYRGKPYDPKADDALPLREELLLIKRYREHCQDMIICDDARIYYRGSFGNGDITYGADHGIDDVFTDRALTIDYRDEGYVIIKRN